MMRPRHAAVVVVLAASSLAADPGAAQTITRDTSAFRADRFWPGVAGLIAADVVVMYSLSQLWYSGHERTSFHWYPYGDGWLDDYHTYVQQDKGGHIFVAWQLARAVGQFGLWSGMSRRQAGLFGGLVSAAFQSQIEYFDGLSDRYGASRTDLLANFIGGAIGGAQVALPDRFDWLRAKYSYHPSPYYDDESSSVAPFRYLGNALKDYDGISYWLVVRPSRMTWSGREAWPDWLAVSVGHSGTGLAHPISGSHPDGSSGGPVHRRQIFVAPDLDLLSLREEWPQPFRAIAGALSFIRLPAPALQLTPRLRWYWVYY